MSTGLSEGGQEIIPAGHVTSTEAERIAVVSAKLAANEALTELLASLGIARGNIESMEEFKADLRFVRSIREGSVKAGARFFMTIVTLFAGAFAYGFVEWLRASLGHGGK